MNFRGLTGDHLGPPSTVLFCLPGSLTPKAFPSNRTNLAAKMHYYPPQWHEGRPKEKEFLFLRKIVSSLKNSFQRDMLVFSGVVDCL